MFFTKTYHIYSVPSLHERKLKPEIEYPTLKAHHFHGSKSNTPQMVNQKKKKNYKTNKQTKPPKQQTKCYISRTLTNFLKTQKMCFSVCIIQVKGLERSNTQGKHRKFFFARDINQNTVPKKHLVPGKGPNLLMDNWILLGF